MAKKNVYDNESISSLKGADRVPETARCYFWLRRAGGLRARGV